MLCSGSDVRIALLALLINFSASAASLTGSVVDVTGAAVAKAAVELDSGAKTYQVRTDDAGTYRFPDLPAGEYTLRFTGVGFKWLTVKSIGLSERERKQIPELTLTPDFFCEFPPLRDFVRLIPGVLLGELSGSVRPPAAGVNVILICRTFRACGATKTDSDGHFSFDMLSAGAYGLSFQRDGFHPKDAIGYEYYVNAGVESVYAAEWLVECPGGNCEGKIQRIQPRCE